MHKEAGEVTVMGIVGGGAYAEVSRIDSRMAMLIPDNIDYIHAAAITETFVTAHEALIHLGDVTKGETVLIHAGAGGVGGAAVQLANAIGATVISTAKKDAHEQVKQLGARFSHSFFHFFFFYMSSDLRAFLSHN